MRRWRLLVEDVSWPRHYVVVDNISTKSQLLCLAKWRLLSRNERCLIVRLLCGYLLLPSDFVSLSFKSLSSESLSFESESIRILPRRQRAIMPLTKHSSPSSPSSRSRNSPQPSRSREGRHSSSGGFHPFGGKLSKHFGDSVSHTVPTPQPLLLRATRKRI